MEHVSFASGSGDTVTNAALDVVDLIPYFLKCWCPCVVGISDRRCWLTSDAVSPGNVVQFPFSIALIYVFLTI